jgi:fructosamine-3-kinase
MNGRWATVEKQLNTIHHSNNHFVTIKPVSGGCINQAWKITDSAGNNWFIKENSPTLLYMFEAEAAGLEAIYQSQVIRIPKPVCSGKTNKFSYLVLEYIPMSGSINQKITGEQLAEMHHITHPDNQYGWYLDNTIGSTQQINTPSNDWVTFWQQQRLGFQLNLAHQKGYSSKDYEAGLKLLESLPCFFTHYQPLASLLHGDLWGGNCASDTNNMPVIFDPACYYGDRETDIAMTELFGGFNQEFYAAYHTANPLDSGYKTRKTLYNLYHILNHYNLFGGGYASQAGSMTQQLLSEV